jgi:hypothetical protein
MRSQLFAARLRSVAADHCARKTSPGVALTVTPDAPATDAAPELARIIVILLPIGKLVVESKGTVIIIAEVEFVSTTIPSSPSTRV